MTLEPGEATGGAEDVHALGDPWLLVVSGRGEAMVAGERVALGRHGLLVIETLNLGTPPEY